MRRKLIVAAIVCFLISIAGLALRVTRSDPRIGGYFERDEVAQLQRAVWNDVRRQSRPGLSWKSLVRWPRWVGFLVAGRVVEIRQWPGPDFAQVSLRGPGIEHFYVFERRDADSRLGPSKKWYLVGNGPGSAPKVRYVDARPAPISAPVDTSDVRVGAPFSPADFSASLSNHTTLSLGR